MPDQDFNIKVVTTADTTGIRQTEAELKKLQQQQATFAETARRQAATTPSEQAAQTGSNLTRSFSAAAGFGYIVARVINGIAEETNKVTAELDKQGGHLVDLAHKWTDMAKSATNAEDIGKIAASGVKELDAMTASINKANQAELTLGQSMVDTLVKAFKNTKDAIGPNEELQNNLVQGLAQIKQQMILQQKEAIELGREYEKTFEENKAKPLRDALEGLSKDIREAKAEQDKLNVSTEGGINRYNELAKKVANSRDQIDKLARADQDRQAADKAREKAAAKNAEDEQSFIKGAVGTSSPQVQRALQQEEAARQAEAVGDSRGADMFRRSSEAFQRGMTGDQQSEFEQLKTAIEQQTAWMKSVWQ